MNLPSRFLNVWGDAWADYAWAVFWQSSLLIAVLWVVDHLLRRRLRPVVRQGLWLLVLLKLLLPPSLALPTGVGYWIVRGHGPEAGSGFDRWMAREIPDFEAASRARPTVLATVRPPQARLRLTGLLMLAWAAGAMVFLAVVVRNSLRWRGNQLQADEVPEPLALRLNATRSEVGLSRGVDLRWIPEGQSPALCGLWRATLLLPRGLADRLSEDQLRAVFFHELVHARRGDVWVNALQVGLQIAWWWHPLLWLANARLRAIREEVVDDEVAFRMGADSVSYPEALVEVAKAAVPRPALSLGLLGIVESRSALRARVERLLAEPPAQMPRLGRWGFAATALLGLLLLPMARGRSTSSNAGGASLEPLAPAGVVTAVEVTVKPDVDSRTGFRVRVPTNDPSAQGALVPRRNPDPWTGQASEPRPAPVGASSLGNSLRDLRDGGTQFAYEPKGAPATNATELVTRAYRLDYSVMIPALEERLGRQLGEDFSKWSAAFREAIEAVGFSTEPPNTMFMTMRSAMLMVRGPAAQVTKVDGLLAALAAQPPQVTIEARFLELTEEAFRSLPLAGASLAGGGPVDPARLRVLTEPQHRTFLEAVNRRQGVRDLGAPRITTLSGRSAEIRQSDSETNAPLSLLAAVRPEVQADNQSIRLETRVEWTQLVTQGPWSPGKRRSESPSLPGPSGVVLATNVQGYVTRSATNTVVLVDGYSQVLGDLGPGELPLGLKRVIVLLKAVLIDRAGNRVHSEQPDPH